jgi:hypothetical protein
MILMELLVHASWPAWLGVAVLLVMAGLLVLAIERSRRKTYKSILSAAPDGTLLMDSTRRGRVLLILRVPDRRLGESGLVETERDTGGA